MVILKDNQIVAQSLQISGFEPTKAAEQAIQEALKNANLSREDIQHITATGAGVNMAPFADSTTSMMGADAKAGAYECEIGTKLPGESREREVVYVFILEEPYE